MATDLSMNTRTEASLQREDVILTSEQLFRQDVLRLHPLSHEQEDALVQRARQGDSCAYGELVLHLMPILTWYARRYFATYSWIDFHFDPLDLVGEAYHTLFEKQDRCLKADAPARYMIVLAQATIRQYCARHQGTITLPESHKPGEVPPRPFQEVSLDQPLIEDEEAFTLLNLVPAPSERAAEQPDSALLCTLRATPMASRERTALLCYYGLSADQEEVLDLAWYQMTPLHDLYQVKDRALTHLQRALAASSLQEAQHILPAVLRERRPASTQEYSLTEAQEHALQQASVTLEQRGEPITVRRLQKLARVDGKAAAFYARKLKQASPPQDRIGRLEHAYHALVQDGQRVTVDELARQAHVSTLAAGAYLYHEQASFPCIVCGADIPSVSRKHHYCSPRCRKRAEYLKKKQEVAG